MIKVSLTTKEDAVFYKLRATGHAGFAKAGSDIVCAAFSVLTINFINSVETLTDDKIKYDSNEGFLEFEFAEGISPESDLLSRSYLLGIRELEKEYGSRYIKIQSKEVK
jgi:hypothetical protein